MQLCWLRNMKTNLEDQEKQFLLILQIERGIGYESRTDITAYQGCVRL